MEAYLSREALADIDKHCRQCDTGTRAIWRCRDCSLASPICRSCIRSSHRASPFHRIEQWNGQFYRPAEQWEVGTHILVQHHTGIPLCETLQLQEKYLAQVEIAKDSAEQERLNKFDETCRPIQYDLSAPAPSAVDDDNTNNMSQSLHEEEEDDTLFMQYLDELREKNINQSEKEDTQDYWEMEDEVIEDETENNPPIENRYLPSDFNVEPALGTSLNAGLSVPVMGTYVRVVHTNGIHNLAMISCECRGHDMLPCDLLASRLLPASFQKIRTLFTAQVLDLFRLSNLELKASAYQFYHLLQRFTCPSAPAEVDNLYREFRRMSWLWRWMKKLKWAGYISQRIPVADIGPGKLAIYCPACPQPGINVAESWRDDPAR